MKVSNTSKASRPINHTRGGLSAKSQHSYVEKLDKASALQLKTNDNDSNRQISIDLVYDKLQNMRDEYKQFYSEEQHFEGAWHELFDDQDHFIDHLIEIFEAHNHVVTALAEFDKTFETTHLASLLKFIENYSIQFSGIYVLIQPDGSFHVKRRKLQKGFNEHPEKFEFLTRADGFLVKLFNFYHSLKAIKPPTTKDEDQLAWYQGLFMDQKA